MQMKLNRSEIDPKNDNGSKAHDKIVDHQSSDKCKLNLQLGTTIHLVE